MASGLLQAAVVVLGFQMVALAWRLHREVYMEERSERIWFTAADVLTYLSLLVLIGSVFVLPAFVEVRTTTTEKWFGLSLVIFASTPLVLAGHYNLFVQSKKSGGRDRLTGQEMWALAVVIAAVIAYLVAWILWGTP